MWNILSAIAAAIFGIGAGITGMTANNTGNAVPLTPYQVKSCYNPEPDVKLSLSWPANFTNLTDDRFTMNANLFNQGTVGEGYKLRMQSAGNPPKFNSEEDTCKPMLFTDTDGKPLTSRTFLRVRRNVRISSCKTDELAGPYNNDSTKTPPTTCDNIYPWGPGPAAMEVRGSCDATSLYPDLRKVAQVNIDGELKDIFWVPYTHNALCQYDPNQPNCGPGTYANLREFVYVLNHRDAFDPNNPSKCVVKWDAGSTDTNACSHYFDVYMAEDLYNKISLNTPVPTEDPDYLTYDFYKQAIVNCTEQTLFMPTFESPTGELPPKFIEKPFVTKDFYTPQQNKILPRNDFEIKNYTYFVLTVPQNYIMNLLQFAYAKDAPAMIACKQGTVTTSNVYTQEAGTPCYIPLGAITFQKATNEFLTFDVYSLSTSPQTFYFQDHNGKIPGVYQYSITEQDLPFIRTHQPALQLNALDFIAENQWTWATPSCKPAIYLYPQKPTNMSVRLDIDGRLTDSSPSYDAVKGWNITAHPNGTIQPFDYTQGKQPTTAYPYLYYEAQVNGVDIPKEGWVVERAKIKDQISKIMGNMGFNEKEKTDFLDFWLPNLTDKPYYFVTLIPEEILNNKEKIIISPKPDSLIRARFVFEGLDNPMDVKPPDITVHSRDGFVVTDWGGALVGKSCKDLIVK